MVDRSIAQCPYAHGTWEKFQWRLGWKDAGRGERCKWVNSAYRAGYDARTEWGASWAEPDAGGSNG